MKKKYMCIYICSLHLIILIILQCVNLMLLRTDEAFDTINLNLMESIRECCLNSLLAFTAQWKRILNHKMNIF